MKSLLTLTLVILFCHIGHTQNSILSFDGINDYVDLGIEVGNEIRTVECWFKLNKPITPQLEDFSTLLAREISGINGNTDEFAFTFQPSFLNNPGTLRFDVDGTFPYKSVYSDNNTWNPDQWYHAAAVIHPEDGMSLFIDGIKQSSTFPQFDATGFSSDITTIGCWGKAFIRYFEGEIDDLRLSKEPLYNSDFIPLCPDQTTMPSDIGIWNFNEPSGIFAIDSSGNSYTGVIVGASRQTAEVCVDSTITNTSNINLDFDLLVYPNPSENSFQFNIQNSIIGTTTISIYSIVGENILTKEETGNSFEIDLKNYPSGSYFYLLKSGTQILNRGRLIKVN